MVTTFFYMYLLTDRVADWAKIYKCSDSVSVHGVLGTL